MVYCVKIQTHIVMCAKPSTRTNNCDQNHTDVGESYWGHMLIMFGTLAVESEASETEIALQVIWFQMRSPYVINGNFMDTHKLIGF